MTTERPDRGARALAERLHKAIADQKNVYYVRDLNRSLLADAILANGAVFLPDAAELERLRRIEAAVRSYLTTLEYEQYLTLHEALGIDPDADLPDRYYEGSAPDGG